MNIEIGKVPNPRYNKTNFATKVGIQMNPDTTKKNPNIKRNDKMLKMSFKKLKKWLGSSSLILTNKDGKYFLTSCPLSKMIYDMKIIGINMNENSVFSALLTLILFLASKS